MSIIESGELAAKKIGSVVPDQAAARGRVPGEVGLSELPASSVSVPASSQRVSRVSWRSCLVAEAGSSKLPLMPEISALAKYPCAACGAQAEWNPAKQALVCPFCGTATPFKVDEASGAIVELDLAKALRELPDDERGWLAEKRTVQCQSCKAVTVFDPERVGQNCEFCGSPALVDYTEIKAPDPAAEPAAVQGHADPGPRADARVVREQVAGAERVQEPRAGRPRARRSTSRTGRSTRRRSARGRPKRGTTTTRPRRSGPTGGRETRQVRHVRWEPASGVVEHFFDDEPVPGTQGVSLSLLKQIEPFPTTTELVPYSTAFLSGFVVEHYQVVLFDAAERSRAAMNSELQRLAAAQIPGRHLSQPPDPADVLEPDLQARARADLAAHLQLRRARLPSAWSTAIPARWPESIRRAPGRSRCSWCSR